MLRSLGPLSPNSPSELDVLWHDGHTLGVDGAQVGVLKQTNQVSLAGLLKKEFVIYKLKAMLF